MKKQLVGFILAGFLLSSSNGMGQNRNYPIKKINGVEYYQYKVESSEGLFAISRKFDLTPDEILTANPTIKDGIKAGQDLLIPVSKKAVTNVHSNSDFIEHRVEKSQTIFAISRKYNVSQEDIQKYNPEIKNGIYEGLVLKIPKTPSELQVKEAEKSAIEKKEGAKTGNKQYFFTHEVKEGETLYSISRQYKVEVADIIELNPNSAATLTAGTELKIPAKDGNTNRPIQKNETTSTFTQLANLSSSINSTKKHTNRTIRMAFLLPFMVEQEKKDASIDRFVDFYAGALIAIKEAKQKGTSFEIYTFDTEKSEDKLKEVLQNSELKTMDLIVGPVFSNQVAVISDFAKENKVNTLIPFTSKVTDIDSNPYLFQFNPGTETELDFATELLTDKQKDLNIVFADLPGVNSTDDGRLWSEGLQARLRKAYRSFSNVDLSLSNDAATIVNVLKMSSKNLIIFNTDKYSIAGSFINQLNTINKDYNIIVFEQYGWRNQTEKTKQSMYISPFTPNINSEKLAEFNVEYSTYFGKKTTAESPRYDLLGYDLTSYFVDLFQRYGNKFTTKIETFNFLNGIQSQPHFENSSANSGFINKRIYLGENQ